MAFKQLRQSTGLIGKEEKQDGEAYVRTAILVHSGPDGKGVTYQSMDGETKPFDSERIRRIVDNQNALLDKLAAEYGGWDKIPDGAFPPLLDSHDNGSSHNALGRMTSKLRYEVKNVPKVGKGVACAVTDLKFLGKDNIERAKDGRVYHLSVGIDEESDTLGEISAVIEPAAPGAMLLAKGKQTSKGVIDMSKKSLAAAKERMTKLSSMKDSLTQLTGKMNKSTENVRLAKAQGDVAGRLTRLMASGKLTPAEVKKLDVKKLASLPADALAIVMSSYEALEPKVLVAQRGSSDSSATVDFASIGASLEKKQQRRLKAEVRGELRRMGAKLKFEEEEEKEMAFGQEPEAKPEHKLADEATEEHHAAAGEHEKHVEQLKHHLAQVQGHLASGNIEEAKKSHEELMKHCEANHFATQGKHLSGVDEVKSEDYKQAMEHLEGELDDVKTNLARMAGMVDELMKVETDEGHDIESAPVEEGNQPGVKA
jgi:hypothetical protein